MIMNNNKLINTLLITTTFFLFVPLQTVFATTTTQTSKHQNQITLPLVSDEDRKTWYKDNTVKEAFVCQELTNRLNEYFNLHPLSAIKEGLEHFLKILPDYTGYASSDLNARPNMEDAELFGYFLNASYTERNVVLPYMELLGILRTAFTHVMRNGKKFPRNQSDNIQQCLNAWLQNQFTEYVRSLLSGANLLSSEEQQKLEQAQNNLNDAGKKLEKKKIDQSQRRNNRKEQIEAAKKQKELLEQQAEDSENEENDLQKTITNNNNQVSEIQEKIALLRRYE
jgi:hypothetical protein